mgnify:FL=1
MRYHSALSLNLNLDLLRTRILAEGCCRGQRTSSRTIRKMTFADAKQILNGSPTVATDYFKVTITDKLVGHFNAIPFARVT